MTRILVLLLIPTDIIKTWLGYQSYGAHKDVSIDFCFMGDNYIMKKVRVVSLAGDMPTGPTLHLHQISNYLTVWDLGLHKILASREKST